MFYKLKSKQKKNFDAYLKMLLSNYLWDDLSHPDFEYGLRLLDNQLL